MENNVTSFADKALEKSFKGFPNIETSAFKGIEFLVLNKEENQYQLIISFYTKINDKANEGMSMRTGSIKSDLNKILEDIGLLLSSGIFDNVGTINPMVYLFDKEEKAVAVMDIGLLMKGLEPVRKE